jgi:hypothetical protein
MRHRAAWLILALPLILATPGRADLIVTIGNASVPQGGTATVDLTISSTSTDLLNNYQFQVQITPNPGTLSQLQFVDPQPQDILPHPPTVYLNDPQYVFFGHSADFTNDVIVGTVSNAGTVYTGSDLYTNPDNGAAVVGTTPLLLARLVVQTPFVSNVGDSFTISLVPPTGGAPDLNTVFFMDEANTQPIPYTSIPGTVTIIPGIQVIPEPGTLGLGLGGAAILGVAGLRARRRRAS